MVQKCTKRSEVGDCIEWKEVGDQLVPIFREEDKKCHPQLYEKWKDKVKNKKLSVLPAE
jgi:hypothetical protein